MERSETLHGNNVTTVMPMKSCFALPLLALIAGASPLSAVAAATAANPPVAAPTMPAIKSLKLEPATLTLKDGRDERRVLVWGQVEGDRFIDLTSQAVFKSDSANLEVGAQGYLRGKGAGAGEVLVSAGNQQIKLPVKV